MPRKRKEDAKNPRGVFEKVKGSGEWWILYYDQDRRRHRKKIGPKSLAIDAYRKTKTKIREGEYFPEKKREKQTVKEAIDAYIEATEGKRSHKTDLYHSKLMKQAFGKEFVEELDAHAIEVWMAKRATEASESTANRSFGFLKRACRKAVRDGKSLTDPTAKVKPFKEPSGRVRFLSTEEETALRKVMKPQEWLLIDFALNTGLRRGEQFGLKWVNIDFQNGVITIPRSKHGEKRHVPMNKRVYEMLQSLKSRLKSEWVFASGKGVGDTPMDANNIVNRVLRPNLTRAGDFCPKCDFVSKPGRRNCQKCRKRLPDPIKDFHWHDLRHTFASRLVVSGVDIRSVQELMGHKDIR